MALRGQRGRESYWDQYDYIDENPLAAKPAPLPDNIHDNQLKLRSLLDDTWFTALASVIKAQPEADNYIGFERPANIIPRRPDLFRSLSELPPHRWRVIIVGDAPNTNMSYASPYSWHTNRLVKKWTNDNCPQSLANIIQNVLMTYDLINDDAPRSKLDELLYSFRHDIDMCPEDWWEATTNQGVLWLNLSLTTGADIEQNKHAKFWRPIVRTILTTILESKTKRNKKQRGTVFVVTNKQSRKFVRSVASVVKPRPVIRVIDCAHPRDSDNFMSQRVFLEINDYLDTLKQSPVYWLPRDFIQKHEKKSVKFAAKDTKIEDSSVKDIKLKPEETSCSSTNASATMSSAASAAVTSSTSTTTTTTTNVGGYDDVDSEDFSC